MNILTKMKTFKAWNEYFLLNMCSSNDFLGALQFGLISKITQDLTYCLILHKSKPDLLVDITQE